MTIGKHSIEAWRLLVIVAAIVFPAVVVAWSSAHAFPDSAAMAVMISITAVFCSFLIEAKIDSELATLRQVGIALIIMLGAGGVAGTILHGQLTRDLSRAKAAWPAYEKEHEEWKKSTREANAESSQRLVNENTSYGEALLRWEAAAARAKKAGIAPPAYPKDTTQKEEKDKLSNQQEPARPKTETDVRDEWAPYNFWQQGIELFLAVFGLTLMSGIKHWDKQEDKKTDEIRAIANRMPENEFAARYPEHYRSFYPNGTLLDKGQPQGLIGSPSLTPPLQKIGFAAPVQTTVQSPSKLPYKTTVPDTVQTTVQTTVQDYRHAGTDLDGSRTGKLDGSPVREKRREIFGVSLPTVQGTRWRPNRRDEAAECLIHPRPKQGIGYLGSLSKNKLSELKALPETKRFDEVRAEVQQWLKENQSKRSANAPTERS